MPRFFVDRPIVAIVIDIVAVVLGLVSMTGLAIAQFPSIIPPIIQIQTTYTGADAVTIEQSVATPLEQQMNGVEKMLYMQSTNANDGTMTLSVTFDVESDVNTDHVNALQQQSAVNPAGRVGGEPAPRGQQLTYTVRAKGRLVTAEEFGDVVVRLTPEGSAVRLKDVSRIELGALSYNQSGRYNGRPGALIAVFQAPGANALAVADAVKARMREGDGARGLEEDRQSTRLNSSHVRISYAVFCL